MFRLVVSAGRMRLGAALDHCHRRPQQSSPAARTGGSATGLNFADIPLLPVTLKPPRTFGVRLGAHF